MTHIAFITLFLGLTMGPQRVDLKVSGPAPRVEMQLDGRTVAILVREPWTTNIDFGRRLLPHQLVARVIRGDDDTVVLDHVGEQHVEAVVHPFRVKALSELACGFEQQLERPPRP